MADSGNVVLQSISPSNKEILQRQQTIGQTTGSDDNCVAESTNQDTLNHFRNIGMKISQTVKKLHCQICIPFLGLNFGATLEIDDPNNILSNSDYQIFNEPATDDSTGNFYFLC